MAKQVRIEMTIHGRGEVFVDEQRVSGVTSVKFEAAVDCTNQVTLTLKSDAVVVEGVADVTHIGSTEREFAKVA